MGWLTQKITDIESAKKAAMYGFWASLIVASVTAIFATISLITKKAVLSIDAYAYVDAILFALFAWRIKKLSRVFSVVAILLFIVEKVDLARTQGTHGLPLACILLVCFINGARGAFAYHRLNRPLEKGLSEMQKIIISRIFGVLFLGTIGGVLLHFREVKLAMGGRDAFMAYQSHRWDKYIANSTTSVAMHVIGCIVLCFAAIAVYELIAAGVCLLFRQRHTENERNNEDKPG
jgi:hypothetical protein